MLCGGSFKFFWADTDSSLHVCRVFITCVCVISGALSALTVTEINNKKFGLFLLCYVLLIKRSQLLGQKSVLKPDKEGSCDPWISSDLVQDGE